MKALAEHIDRQLLGTTIGKCAVDEQELQRLWPIDMDDRKAAIEQFAREYGFQLIYYSSGICAIFEKESPRSW